MHIQMQQRRQKTRCTGERGFYRAASPTESERESQMKPKTNRRDSSVRGKIEPQEDVSGSLPKIQKETLGQAYF